MISLENLGPWTEIISRLGWLILLYPEIHYTFKYFPFSRYRIEEPEILTDAPYRIGPGKNVPVLLLIKDADRYPIRLHSVTFRIGASVNDQSISFSMDQTISEAWWHRLFFLEIPDEMRGRAIEIQSEISCRVHAQEKKILNDNFPGLSHRPLNVFCAREPLPSKAGWIYGDLHYHTNYTSDQVEFGAPLDATVEAAKSIGLDFFAATDHSYDLDDREDDYLNNDPHLVKWKKLQSAVADRNLADKTKFVILPGEEVTCANAKGQNVHCLVLNGPEFIPGSGDGAERWLRTDSEFSVPEIGEKTPASAIALAAHPKDPAPLFEKIFIRRGQWHSEDCRAKNISGLQILNGLDNRAFRAGLTQWTDQLLLGDRIFIFAGNDAHGNFNRFRQVKTPMLKLHEIENHQRFGWAKTCVRLGEEPPTVDNIIRSMKNGRTVITNGPLVLFSAFNESKQCFQLGDEASGKRFHIFINSLSSEEMGALEEIRIIQGELHKKETVVKLIKVFPQPFYFDLDFHFQGASYLRCEAVTTKKLFCYTNPIWFTES